MENEIQEMIRQFMEKDAQLLNIKETDKKAHEIAISHRLAVYLEKIFHAMGLTIDLEYNKHGADTKRFPDGSNFRSDIIVHERENDDKNLIAIEVKKQEHSPADKEAAILRIQRLCEKKASPDQYGYQFGYVIEASKDGLKIIYSYPHTKDSDV